MTALLFLLPIGFFRAVLFTQQLHFPYDLIDQMYPWHFAAQRALLAGDLPWWSPWLFSGYPAVADPQAQLLYPPSWIMYLLAPPSGLPYGFLEWNAVLHLSWMAAGTYLLARRSDLSRLASVFAAVGTALSGFTVSHPPHLPVISTLSWTPWALAGLLDAWRGRERRGVTMAGLALGLAYLAGHPPSLLHMVYFLAAVAVGRWVITRPPARAVARQALLGLSAASLGAVIALPQLWLTAEFWGLSSRGAFSVQDAATSSLHPGSLLTLLLPNAFAYDGPASYWGPGDVAETYLYSGIWLQLLAVMGLWLWRGRRAVLLAAGTSLALLLSMGTATPLHGLAYGVLPGYSLIKRPVNLAFFFGMGLAFLAAMGVERLTRGKGRSGRWWWGGAALLVAVAPVIVAGPYVAEVLGQLPAEPARLEVAARSGSWVAGVLILGLLLWVWQKLGPLNRVQWGWAVLALTLVDLSHAGSVKRFNAGPYDPALQLSPGQDVLSEASWLRYVKAASAQESAPVRLHLPEGWSPPGPGRISNGAAVWGVPVTWGYSPLRLARYEAYYEGARESPQGLARLRAVYVLEEGGGSQGTPPGLRHLLSGRYDWREVDLYAVEEPHPWAWVEGDPGAEAILERYAPTSLRLRVSSPRGGRLVMSEVHYPGWRAELDGRPVRLEADQEVFRSLWLPPGEHTVELSFRPWALVLGLPLSAGMLLTGAFILALRRVRARPALALTAAALLLLGGWKVQQREALLERPVYLLYELPEAERVFRLEPGADEGRYGSLTLGNLAGTIRPALFQHPLSEVRFRVRLPDEPTLTFGYGIDQATWSVGDGVTFVVELERDGERMRLFRDQVNPHERQEDRMWKTARVDLPAGRGWAWLVFRTEPGPADDYSGDWALWAEPTLWSGEPAR